MATNNFQLKNQISPVNTSRVATDINAPYSFQDWKKAHSSVIPDQEYELYNQYLADWFTRKKEQRIEFDTQLQLDYLNLLRQLQLFLTTEEKENWYNNIDLTNEKEVLLAIPFFAKKLKEIAIYYLKIREEIKKTKIKYNLIGTNAGLTQQLQEQLLNSFTKKPNSYTTIPATIWSGIPELSSVKDNLVIEVEELYDDQQYFDRSPDLPASTYFNLTGNNTANYFTQKGLSLSAIEWIFKTDTFYTDIFELSSQISSANPDGAVNALNFANNILTKYLGTEKYTSAFLGLSSRIDFYNVDIQSGDNFFYWPYGPYKKDLEIVTRYRPLSLSSIGLENISTPGITIDQADTIFVKTKNNVQGAWLRFIPYYETTQDVTTYIDGNSKTIFKYPFPGYGLSAENTNWTGPSITYTPEFAFLSPDLKKGIEAEYWNFNAGVSSLTPIKINDSSLIDAGSYANTQYELADKVKIWRSSPLYDSSTYSGTIEEAWLYKMLKTDIPVAASLDGQTNNTILWPYNRIDPAEPFPTYFPLNINTVCQPTPLSAINLPFSTASESLVLNTGDAIYKIANYQDTPELALECAWLHNTKQNYDNFFKSIKQDSFSYIFNPQVLTSFIWDGEDNTDLETVFKTLPHQPDCPFFNKPSATPDEHPLCKCGQVNFSPFGHPGEMFTDFNGFADFVVEDTQFPSSFDLNTWKDRSNVGFQSSTAFAWYQTNNSKLGWGYGRWRTGNGLTDNKFYLRAGRKYLYYRSNTRSAVAATNPFPSLVVRYPYSIKTSNWKKAVLDETGNWMATNSASDMIINPGDLLIYLKSPGTTHDYINVSLTPTYTAVNTGTIWSNYDFISIYPDPNGQPPSITVQYPSEFTLSPQPVNLKNFLKKRNRFGVNSSLLRRIEQTPVVAQTDILAISAWIITTPYTTATFTTANSSISVADSDSETYVIYNTNSFSFSPLISGIYNIQAVVITSANISQINLDGQITRNLNLTARPLTGVYYLSANTIPSITAANFTTTISSISSFFIPTPGFVINTQLYGWNYNTNTAQTNVLGARPFWAVGFTGKNAVTNNKEIVSWGTPLRLVDGYNVVSQPVISETTLETGNYVEYNRNYPTSFVWKQPTDFLIQANKAEWNTLLFDTTAASNLTPILDNLKYELTTSATNIPSNISITNIVDNEPVEIYYNAINPFTWNISVEPEISETVINTLTSVLVISPDRPWNTIPNRYFPTIALYPSVEQLYSKIDKGGYFIPQNLGASVYLNKSFTAKLNLSSTALSGIFNDGSDFPNGRGLTKFDQPTPFTNIFDNNTWLKEPIISGPLAGTIKKDIAKKYQKFIPYQSFFETDPKKQMGLILPTSRQSPWGGREDSEWTDLQNRPISYTGVPNVSAWSNTQLLKRSGKQLDNWVTDIYGNQYGLYKDLQNISPFDRRFIGGELWTRKNSQFVSSASDSLTGVFDTYNNTVLQTELLGTGIRKIDIFFDTLYVETSSCVLFEKIVYNYDDDKIYSITDDARFLSLAIPVSASLQREIQNTNLSGFTFAKIGDTWFLPNEKLVYVSVCGLSSYRLTPQIYKLNLLNRDFIRVFPNTEDIITINSLSSLQLIEIDPPLLTYNSTKKQFVYSLLGKNTLSSINLIEFQLNSIPEININETTIYQSLSTNYNNLPPVVYNSLAISANVGISFAHQVSAYYNPTSFTLTNSYSWLTLNNTGLFTGTPPTTSTYYIPFSVSNNVGPTYYTLTINAI